MYCLSDRVRFAGILFWIGVSENLTDKTRYEVLRNVYENINVRYSIEAVNHLYSGNSRHEEYLRENYFKIWHSKNQIILERLIFMSAILIRKQI